MLARIPNEVKKRDITGGLPRVADYLKRDAKRCGYFGGNTGIVSFGKETKGKHSHENHGSRW